ncbi:hypothetical protein D3C73_1107800 [compost metagenome]
MTGQPLLARRQHAALRRQQGADALTSLEAIQHSLQAPADDDGVRTGARRQACRTQFGLHATTTQRPTCTARHRIERRIIGARLVDQLGVRIVARIGVEHAIAIREDHQQIGFDQVGHQRRQGVVVAEADLISDHGVVFVDHRNHFQFNQGTQRAAGIQVALAVRQVVMGQENLRGVPIMLGKA